MGAKKEVGGYEGHRTSLRISAKNYIRGEGVLASDVMLLFLLFLLLVVFSSILVPNFLKIDNLLNLARIVSLTGVMAVGMTYVLLLGEVDLSVGSTMSLSTVIGGQFLFLGAIPAVGITLLAGTLLGLINGLFIVKGKIPSLIMTLATLIIYGGFAHVLVKGAEIFTYNFPAYTWIGKGQIAGLPSPVIIFAIVIFLSMVLLHCTSFGRWVYYTGSNRVASHYSGGNTDKVRIVAFMICGFCASCSGPMISATLQRIWPAQGVGYELAAITIALLGGASLWGGKGNVIGTLIAAMIFGCLVNVLNMSGVGTYLQEVVKGLLLITVVGIAGFRGLRANG